MSINHLPFIILFALLSAACSNPKQIKPGDYAEFLNEYDFEKTGAEDNALLSYWHKPAVWQAYDKIIVEPVIFDLSPDSALQKMAHADRVQLQDYIEFQLRRKLGQTLTLVETPAENTLRIRLAITDSQTSHALAEIFSYIHPPARSSLALNALLSSLSIKGWKANLKAELSDASTGDLLMAAANAKDEDDSWSDSAPDSAEVQNLANEWLERISYQLCTRQHRGSCAGMQAAGLPR